MSVLTCTTVYVHIAITKSKTKRLLKKMYTDLNGCIYAQSKLTLYPVYL